MQAEQQSERERFEAWDSAQYEIDAEVYRHKHGERYVDRAVQCRWEAWQARAALSHPSTPQGWRGIDSAPRDGTPVFAFWPPSGSFPVHGGCYGVAVFQEGRWCNPEDSDDDYIEPSHYMPLPPPPEQGSKG